MERGTPVRKPHTSTSDLLTWSESRSANPSSSANASRSAARPNQPSDRIGEVLFGGQITDEEAERLNKRKPCSGYKLKEMTGSKIFADGEEIPESGTSEANLNNRTSVRIVQQAANGISQISFSTEEKISPKKPTTIPEVAKQRELSGTLESESESKIKKQISNAKSKELSGSDIFGPPPEILPRSLAAARTVEIKENKAMGEPAPRTVRTSVKVSNEMHTLFVMFHGSIRGLVAKESTGGITRSHLYYFIMDFLSDFFIGKKLQLPNFRDSLKERGSVMLTVGRDAATEIQDSFIALSNLRELYMVLEKANETLLYASEAVEKFSDRYCNGAFSLDKGTILTPLAN